MAEDAPAIDAGTRIPHQRRPSAAENIQEEAAAPHASPCNAGTTKALPGMARYLTDPAIEEEIQAFIASAPPLPEDKRARLARLLRTKHCRHHHTA
jgi:hypothetical protein